jgi:hypothetical protein
VTDRRWLGERQLLKVSSIFSPASFGMPFGLGGPGLGTQAVVFGGLAVLLSLTPAEDFLRLIV